jgi:integrase
MSGMGKTAETAGCRTPRRRQHEGIEPRHQRRCEAKAGKRCSCTPTYQAQVWSPRDQKQVRKTFLTVAEARAWRQESQVALRRGTLRAPSPVTLSEAAGEWLIAAEAGVIRTRSGDAYKPAALRAYRQSLNHHVLPVFGSRRLTAISRVMLQDFADRLVASGLSASSVRNAILPLRAIYRRALNRDEVAVDPTRKLTLPSVRSNRDRVAAPAEATALLDALPLGERALWATALYAGLRMGELQALDWNQVDLGRNVLRVERSWDRTAGFIEPKSRSGRRLVPITNALRHHLLNHRLHQGTGGQGLVFRNDHGTKPFNPSTTNQRAKNAWAAAALSPITLHECRHSYAAYMIAAGVNTKALSTYMGHSSIVITLDRYGHLLPGNEAVAADLLDTWLIASNSATLE